MNVCGLVAQVLFARCMCMFCFFTWLGWCRLFVFGWETWLHAVYFEYHRVKLAALQTAFEHWGCGQIHPDAHHVSFNMFLATQSQQLSCVFTMNTSFGSLCNKQFRRYFFWRVHLANCAARLSKVDLEGGRFNGSWFANILMCVWWCYEHI